MRTHTQGVPVERILHWARGENKGEGWSNVQSIGKKGRTQQGLKKALPQPFSFFLERVGPGFRCASQCVWKSKDSASWSCLPLSPARPKSSAFMNAKGSVLTYVSLNEPNGKRNLPSKHQILDLIDIMVLVYCEKSSIHSKIFACVIFPICSSVMSGANGIYKFPTMYKIKWLEFLKFFINYFINKNKLFKNAIV